MDEAFALRYEQYEANHWWFRGRRAILGTLIGNLPWPRGAVCLEIGVGPGLNLATLYPPQVKVIGLEPNRHNLMVAARRSRCPILQGTAERLPPEIDSMRFDAITLFDVLEHVEEDELALKQLAQRLKPGGWLLLTVPAYQWLWGRHDLINNHYRRYTLNRLGRKLEGAGLRMKRGTYFNTILFPLAALVRLVDSFPLPGRKERGLRSDFELSTWGLNSLLGSVFSWEKHWVRHFNFPFGFSLYCQAELVDGPVAGSRNMEC